MLVEEKRVLNKFVEVTPTVLIKMPLLESVQVNVKPISMNASVEQIQCFVI